MRWEEGVSARMCTLLELNSPNCTAGVTQQVEGLWIPAQQRRVGKKTGRWEEGDPAFLPHSRES